MGVPEAPSADLMLVTSCPVFRCLQRFLDLPPATGNADQLRQRNRSTTPIQVGRPLGPHHEMCARTTCRDR